MPDAEKASPREKEVIPASAFGWYPLRMKTVRKSSVAEIRSRFDRDVERFSRLETGQVATMDASLCLGLVAEAGASTAPREPRVLDIGCGAGNFSLKFRELRPRARFTLVDLSRPMLDRARERLGSSVEEVRQGDMRTLEFGESRFDVVLAAAVLHHLRTPREWRRLFGSVHRWLRPGGGFWIFDLVDHELRGVRALMRARYRAYLEGLGGAAYRDRVLAAIEREDTPAPLTFQLDLLREAGFARVDVLHKNACFAAFGGVRARGAAAGQRRAVPSRNSR